MIRRHVRVGRGVMAAALAPGMRGNTLPAQEDLDS
ncbi:hypothetical protein OKW34_003349 [Paraburkholderia youngii]